MSEPIYRRSQAEWTLWRAYSDPPPAGDIDPTTRTRIKRLLDIDRSDALARGARSACRWAFSAEATAGSGAEAAFTPFDVFCLGLGLELLDFGFKQAEIVFLIRHIRRDLRAQFDTIIASYPPVTLQRLGARDYPRLPRTPDGKHPDDVVFMLIRQVQLDEIAGTRQKPPAIFKPEFARGATALLHLISTNTAYRRKAILIEIAVPARRIQALLARAPLRKRGPKT